MLIVLGVSACNAFSQNANSVTLAWDPNPEPDIAGYILYYGTASGVYSSSVTMTNAATCSVSNLLAGVTYFFAVTAYDAAGLQRDPSNEISYTVPAPSGAPSLDPIPNLTVSVDASPQSLALTGIRAPISKVVEAGVTLTAISRNPALIPNPVVQYSRLRGTGTLTFTTAPAMSGSAIVTVTASVGLVPLSISRSFTITVAPVTHAPVITGLPDFVTTEVNKPITLAFHVSDLERPPEDLLVIAESFNKALISSDDILLEGTGTDRTVTLHPLPNEFGLAIIRFRVLDPGGASASTILELGVNPITDPPVPPLLRIAGSGKVTTLSWSASALGFQLEASDALIPPGWNRVDAAVRVVSDRNIVTLVLPRGSRFFRLRKP